MIDHSPTNTVPTSIRTQRLYMRPWQADDARELLPILQVSGEHLRWIPERISAPAPIDELSQRLRQFGDDFAASREFRYAVFTLGEGVLQGEAALFARNQTARVPLAEADRVEIGYWLRPEATGHGYATEAAHTLVDVARKLNGITRVEIRCDARNGASAAIPRRLGFTLLAHGTDADPHAMLWVLIL